MSQLPAGALGVQAALAALGVRVKWAKSSNPLGDVSGWSLVLVPSWWGQTLGDPQSHLGAASSPPSPGCPQPISWACEVAGIWLLGPHVAVPAGAPGTMPRPWLGAFGTDPAPWLEKTRLVLSKQPGPGQCLTPAPRPAALLDAGTWGRRHGPSTSPLPPPPPKLGCGRGAGDTQRGPTGHQVIPTVGWPWLS